MFTFTDSIVFEGRYYKVDPSRPGFHAIVLQKNGYNIIGAIVVHVIHITVAKVKELGIYIIPRGYFWED